MRHDTWTRRGLETTIAIAFAREVATFKHQWTAAEIFPSSANARLTVTAQQAEQLKLFAF